MSFLGKTKTKTIDPYMYFFKHGGFGYNKAQSALEQLLAGANDPGRSPEYAMGKQLLDQSFAEGRERTGQILTQRGTAFGGQARRAHIDMDANRNNAMRNLIMQIMARKPQFAGMLGQLASSMKMAPITYQKYSPGLVDKMAGFDSFMGSLNSSLSQGAQTIGSIYSGGGQSQPATGSTQGYSASPDDLAKLLGLI